MEIVENRSFKFKIFLGIVLLLRRWFKIDNRNNFVVVCQDQPKGIVVAEKLLFYFKKTYAVSIKHDVSLLSLLDNSTVVFGEYRNTFRERILKRVRNQEFLWEINSETQRFCTWELSYRASSRYYNIAELSKESEVKFNAHVLRLQSKFQFQKAYVFGTGPSLNDADYSKFQDGYKIVCNSFVKNKVAWNQLQPDFIIAADGIHHFSSNTIAQMFLFDLNKRMSESDVVFVYPITFHSVVANSISDEYHDRLIPMPMIDTFDLLVLTKQHGTCGSGNSLNVLSLPLACRLTKEIYLFGYDGQNPEKQVTDNTVWQNAEPYSYKSYEGLIKRTDYSYYAYQKDLSTDGKYMASYFGERFEQQLLDAENEGYRFRMMHKTFNEVLNRSY